MSLSSSAQVKFICNLTLGNATASYLYKSYIVVLVVVYCINGNPAALKCLKANKLLRQPLHSLYLQPFVLIYAYRYLHFFFFNSSSQCLLCRHSGIQQLVNCFNFIIILCIHMPSNAFIIIHNYCRMPRSVYQRLNHPAAVRHTLPCNYTQQRQRLRQQLSSTYLPMPFIGQVRSGAVGVCVYLRACVCMCEAFIGASCAKSPTFPTALWSVLNKITGADTSKAHCGSGRSTAGRGTRMYFS